MPVILCNCPPPVPSGTADGQVPVWDETTQSWVPGTAPAPECCPPDGGANGDILVWDGSQWVAQQPPAQDFAIVQTLIANGTSSVTFDLSSVNTGNLMIIGIYFRVQGDGTITVPVGWTNEVDNTDNPYASKSWALSRIKLSGDTSVTINFSGTNLATAAILLEIEGASSTISNTSNANGSSSPAVMPSVDNGEPGDLLVCFNSAAITNNNEDAFGTPLDMTKQRISFYTSEIYRHTIVLFTQVLTSGATGTRNSTVSDMFINANFGWASLGLIVKPS